MAHTFYSRFIILTLCVAFQSPLLQGQNSCNDLDLDSRIVVECNSIQSTKSTSRFVSSTMIPLAVALPVSLYATGMLRSDKQLAESGVALFCANATTLGMTYITKLLIQRQRPWRSHPDCIAVGEVDNEYSFPSGHASGSTVMATYLSLRYPKWYVIAPACLYASYTWYARMNLGVHYPTDILVGAILGASVGYLAYRLTDDIAAKIPSILPLVSAPPDGKQLLLSFSISL